MLYEVKREGSQYVRRPVKWVAKESRFAGQESQKLKFHEVFCRTQMKAQRIAQLFNKAVLEQKKRHSYLELAKIAFLDCFVYTMNEDDIGVLVEKYIDHRKYKKWNTNNGFVDGRIIPASEILNPTRKNAARILLNDITEGESSDDEFDYELHAGKDIGVSRIKYQVKIDDYPQAFSHYSYRCTNRKMIVCDLQGVLDVKKRPPVYELTDPVIHYSSKKEGGRGGRRFGRTDLGESGVNMFFTTHQCNELCKLLGLNNN